MSLDQDKVKETMEADTGGGGTNIADSLTDLMEHLSDDERHKMFSELSKNEIKHLSVLATLDDDLMNDFIREYMTIMISHKRRGRKEHTELATAFSDIFGLQESDSGLIDRAKSLVT